ncbi:MAG TPA: nitroreductase family protein [Gemmatimonadales bacterium]|nr:nitroreductase family protein [Gemmatimonadales bacterium]
MASSIELESSRGTFDAIYQRRAVRSFTTEPVTEATVRRLLDAAVHAPTAMHLEPWAFVVIQDRAALRRYSDQAKVIAQGEATTHRDLLKAPTLAASASEHLRLLSGPSFDIFHGAGTLILICAKPLGSFATADCWLAAENLMLAGCALGLGTCCIGYAVPVLNAPDVKRELGIPEDVTAVAPIIVGVPQGPVPGVPRRPPEILRWVR